MEPNITRDPRLASPLRRLLRLLRPYRVRVTLAVLAAAVSAAAAAAYAWLVGPLLKGVLVGGPVSLGPIELEAGSWRRVLPLAIVLAAAVKAASQLLQTGWMQAVGQKTLAAFRAQVFEHLVQVDARAMEGHASGDIVSRLTSDVSQVEFAVTQALTSYVRDGLQLVALLVLCAALDVRLFLLSFVVLPLTLIPVMRFARAVKRAARATQGSLGRLTALVGEQLHGLPVVQAFGGEGRARERFDAEQRHYLSAMDRSLVLRGAASPTVELLGVTGLALALAVGTRAVAHEPALAAGLLSYVGAVMLMYGPLKGLSGTFSQVVQGLGAAERLLELELLPRTRVAGRPAGPLRRAVRFEDLRVRYAAEHDEALAGLSLEVPAGRTVALVGASGAGKSTAFAALLGFVEPSSGRILWDEEDVRALALPSLRAQMAWVSQEPVLFSGSVRDAVLLGRPGASDREVWEALRLAHAEAFVRAFPRGLDEEVGERGSRLSGGQRQRLAIARAFLRQPSLLLLDEPTSALDAASEAEVREGLQDLMSGRTTLVIAHRLSTVRHADVLYVLEAGRVVEQGSHDALEARGGVYARLLTQGAPWGDEVRG
ncbi:MAG TPA: ABC transporter ATP-binding protein [Myxococcaceae bacterium]|nr:ABC transporter ATP-binding protein [Myxococcaceae bacterium]